MSTPLSRHDITLSSDVVAIINHIKDSYETAWKQSLTGADPPRQEAFLSVYEGNERDVLISELERIDRKYRALLISSSSVAQGETLAQPIQVYESPSKVVHKETIGFEAPEGTSTQAKTVAGSRVGNYELLGELGHGGMGVVYKARHLTLDRFVALKMVLAGAHAPAAQLSRFISESQTIARLQHPNIVQLFEVGEHDGLPFIALEYVEGGSLAQKTGGRPMTSREAAELLAILAGAMDYAHRHGVIHRDLKPANILLTGDGIPKVVDFGLAKRLEADSVHTRTGTLMGTPSYMAPEQARGENQTVGSHTDVYALGAVLYEMLTGRPPFLAANAMETVMAVLKSEPIAPCRLKPRIPRDLETICLKCLQKEPEKRYASAAALADDLHRMLAGEPIRARPVGRAERLVRWARRHPGIAGLTGTVMLLLTTIAIVSTIAAIGISEGKRVAEQNATAAGIAQKKAEEALEEAELQKKAAVEAKSQTEVALKQTDAARTVAVKARKQADDNARVAEDQRELALDALGALVTKVQDQLSDAPDTQKLKKELLESALEGLRKVAATGDQATIVDIRSAEGHRRLGELFSRLGDLALARREYEFAHSIVKKQAVDEPNNPDWKRFHSITVNLLGDLCLLVGDEPGARKWYSECLGIRLELVEFLKHSVPSKVDLAQVLVKLGGVTKGEEARDHYQKALKLREEILAPDRTSGNAWRDVWVSNLRLSEWNLKQKNLVEARKHANECLRISTILTRGSKLEKYKADLAFAHFKSGDVFRADNKPGDAAKSYAKAVELQTPISNGNPLDLVSQITLALFLAHAGDHLAASERAHKVKEAAPKNPFLLFNLACVYSLCAAEAEGGNDEVRKLATEYSEAAVNSLRAAITAGYVGFEQIRTDPDLTAARSAAAYRELEKMLQ